MAISFMDTTNSQIVERIAGSFSCFFTRAAAQLNPEGLRKLREYRDDLIATGKYRVVAKHSYEEECIDMPISTLSVSAGTGTFLDEGNFETISFPKSAVPCSMASKVMVLADL